MSPRRVYVILSLALLFFQGIAFSQPAVVSTAEHTEGVSLTVYNQNFAIVREKRSIELEQGINFVRYEDVASQIDPTSMSFKSLTTPASVSVREQNYQYDLLNPTSILNKSVGKQVRFRRVNPDGKADFIEGELLNPPTATTASTDAGRGGTTWQGLVIRTPDGKLHLNPAGEMILDELPEGLVSRPSLLWKLNVDQGGKHSTETNYLTNGITWKADYVAVVSDDETKVDITGWVTIDNRSGATYKDAGLQLIAGDVRRVREQRESPNEHNNAIALSTQSSRSDFEEESFFEYHLYTLDGKTTVSNAETKQLTLLTADNVGLTRKLVYDPLVAQKYRSQRRPGDGSKTEQHHLSIIAELHNAKENNMGMPLPKGKMRMYKADARGNTQFLGEDLIEHTPKDEVLKLYVGEAFDATAERKRTNYEKTSERSRVETFEVVIRNHKDVAVEAIVIEHLYHDWEMLEQSHQHNPLDSHTIEFPLTVPKNGEVKVTFTIGTRW